MASDEISTTKRKTIIATIIPGMDFRKTAPTQVMHLLRRLVDADGKLLAHQINPETDAETIIAAERDGFVYRDIKQMAAHRSKCRSVSITPDGRKFLEDAESHG